MEKQKIKKELEIVVEEPEHVEPPVEKPPKKPRTEKQLASDARLRERNKEKAKLKNDATKKRKEEADDLRIQTAIEKTLNKQKQKKVKYVEPESSSSEEEVVKIKRKKAPPKKKKIVQILEDSSSSEEETPIQTRPRFV